jgi:hypothetical protein
MLLRAAAALEGSPAPAFGAKIRTLKAIAGAIDRRELDLPALADKPAEEAHAALTAVHGIGPDRRHLSLFCLGHADAGPQAISPCKRRRGSCSRSRRARPPRTWDRSRSPGGPGEGGRLHAVDLHRAGQQRDGAPFSDGAEGQWLSSTVCGSSRARARRQLVVFLHGYGATATTSSISAALWQGSCRRRPSSLRTRPEPCGQAPVGRQWFPLTFRDPNERWLGVNKASPALAQFLDAELKRCNLPPSALALVGFSQGTMMALQ